MSDTSSDIMWAAPSCVINGTVAENADFLAGKTAGIALCLFETDACMAYNADDLPGSRGEFTWHIHLPLDLPWQQGGKKVAEICALLCAKTSALMPALAVLHPPETDDVGDLLAQFAACWHEDVQILLENVAWCDIHSLGSDFLREHSFGFCLDVAHAFCWCQNNLVKSDLPEQARLFHWSAPNGKDRHLPLSLFTKAELKNARDLMTRARPDAIHLLEIFNWAGVAASVPILRSFRAGGLQ